LFFISVGAPGNRKSNSDEDSFRKLIPVKPGRYILKKKPGPTNSQENIKPLSPTQNDDMQVCVDEEDNKLQEIRYGMLPSKHMCNLYEYRHCIARNFFYI
jgi:hypothetical protein